ncbi:MAG: thrombospondin type 3 repeat-containing protein [Deltaproteobacteria bacterium]|nr:thrombospondin type 3 repeat-containing protein [Deltaproteobacteria bacterium]MDQ3295262.1 thrombospondin type 3 repeat-containing protein [Myxococcota bacterium]
MNAFAARAAIAAIACFGCNAVFGLGPTLGPDGDGDGALDGADNCAVVPNPDQRDGDGDALGDACDPCDGPQSGKDGDGDGLDDLCDPCPIGSNHDEDGDGALDGCDVCPADSDDQADADGDGVGDVCDAAPGVVNKRIFFDGFGPPRADWRAWFKAWQPTADGYVPVTGGDYVGAWHTAARVTGRGWWIEAAVVTPTVPSYDYFGLFVREVPSGFQLNQCLLEYNNGEWRPNYDPDSLPITLGSITRFRFFARAAEAQCMIDGIAVTTSALAPDDTSFVPSLATGLGTEFLWIDVVIEP